MSYVEKTMSAGEKIRYRAHFNWTYDFSALFWLLLGASPLFLTLYLDLVRPPASLSDNLSSYIFGGVAFFMGFIVWLVPMVRKWTTEIAVTNQRFVYKRGLISRSTEEVSLNKIEEVSLRQSFWGRVFGYGRLTIRGSGVGVIELPELDEPVKLRRSIMEAKGADHDDNGD
ncbi:MAG: hypothetical protein Tsb0010_13350 [Parvularculaceae bacterium]